MSSIRQQLQAKALTEGAGVTVHRTIGTPALRHYDPFLMLDQISSDNPDEYIAGFPPHPHRGFITFTYMIDGDMEHRDSLGNTGNLGPGGAQWMKAASGVVHSEMPKQAGGLMRGFQLWINLPAANKMDAPEYREYRADAFPIVEEDGVRVKVLVGHYNDIPSPIIDEITQVQYLDVSVPSGAVFTPPISKAHHGFIYLFEGEGQVAGTPVNNRSLLTLEAGQCEFVASERGARFLFVSGAPIGEPVVQYGPFVMNTQEEVDQAMRDYQSNHFVRDKAWVNRPRRTD